jgi:epoxyqueuosine reductase
MKLAPNTIVDILQHILVPSDMYIFGTADLTGLIDKKFGEYRYGISVGKKLDDTIVDAIIDGPTLEYYHHYNQVNKDLAKVASGIKKELLKAGIEAIVIEPTVSTSSKEFDRFLPTLTVEVSHKMVATRAGLGWIGKTDLFISKKFGPRLRLVSLLIKEKPEGNFHPVDKSRCGNCRICVEKCPAQAANGLLWNTGIHRDEFFNAYTCRDKCGELAKQRLNVDVRICGLCVAICPLGKKSLD